VPPPGPNAVAVDHPERFALVATQSRPTADRLRADGVVSPDVNRTVPVLSLGGGRVVDIRARLGDDVRKGQILLTIHSPDLMAAFADYQKAQADEVLARKQLDRTAVLCARGAAAEKDLEAARDAEDHALVDLKALAARIQLLGGDPDRPSQLLEVRAPISGTIVEQNVTGGAGVRSLDNSPNLFTIADLSRVWVLCDVYEDGLARIRTGDAAEVRLNALPDRPFVGRVSNISRVLDPTTRSAKVRIELDNPGGVMRTGMFAIVVLRSQTIEERPVVPTAAVVRMHDKDWVFRPLGGDRFERSEVQLGDVTADDRQVVLAGLRAGDLVVANALQFFRSTDAR
jgi:cobalt-zinc-cadmium efflux system membrane fusion protein